MKITESQIRRIVREEMTLAESPVDALAREIGAEVHTAYGHPGDTVLARRARFSFPDGVPSLKSIARAPEVEIELPEEFKVVDDYENGWWYFQVDGRWYGIRQDGMTPPFDV